MYRGFANKGFAIFLRTIPLKQYRKLSMLSPDFDASPLQPRACGLAHKTRLATTSKSGATLCYLSHPLPVGNDLGSRGKVPREFAGTPQTYANKCATSFRSTPSSTVSGSSSSDSVTRLTYSERASINYASGDSFSPALSGSNINSTRVFP